MHSHSILFAKHELIIRIRIGPRAAKKKLVEFRKVSKL